MKFRKEWEGAGKDELLMILYNILSLAFQQDPSMHGDLEPGRRLKYNVGHTEEPFWQICLDKMATVINQMHYTHEKRY